ncbi:class I SAM-dependent methyltransferase [Nannocystaceae bacterium ST9]
MALPPFVLEQLGRPHGRLAALTGFFLNRANARAIREAIATLELRPGQRVVEVGFGGGYSLSVLLRAVGAEGHVFALELSDELLARARRRYIVPRMQGRLRIDRAPVEQLPLADASFDAALSMHTIFFWTDVDRGLDELARVLKPGGRLVLGLGEPEMLTKAGFAAHGHRVVVPERLAEHMPAHGFERVAIHRAGRESVLVSALRSNSPPPTPRAP